MALETDTASQLDPLSDLLLCQLKASYEALTSDADALSAVLFWVVLPIATRSENPIDELRSQYRIDVRSPQTSDLMEALDAFVPSNTLVKEATRQTVASVGDDKLLLGGDDWAKWRAYDGPEFCNLAYRFFSNLNAQYFKDKLPSAPSEVLDVFSREMAVITRAFSARWLNARARFEMPSRNSVRWYLGHCLGKLDLELSREMSDWVELPRKRKGEPEPSLDL